MFTIVKKNDSQNEFILFYLKIKNHLFYIRRTQREGIIYPLRLGQKHFISYTGWSIPMYAKFSSRTAIQRLHLCAIDGDELLTYVSHYTKGLMFLQYT